jgi:heme/copper-type cytochrome/quinol oxidase subunit 3
VRRVDAGEGYLPDAEEGLRETLVTTPVDARPVQVLRVAPPSYLPMLAAIFVGGFFVLSTFKVYAGALVSAGLGLAVILGWLWTGTALVPEKATKEVGIGDPLPIYVSGSGSVGWWGMLVTMLADLTAFLSLVFGYLFFWTVHADFPPAALPDPHPGWLVAGLVALLASWGLTGLAIGWNRRDRSLRYTAGMLGAVALAVAGGAAVGVAPWVVALDARAHAYGAIVWILAVWVGLHALLGGIMQAVLPRPTGRRPDDGDPRHGPAQRPAVLALRRGDRGARGAGARRLPAGGVSVVVPDERRDNLWWLVAPAALWLAHFGGSYALVAVGCPRVPPGVVYAGLAIATALTLGPLGALVGIGWRRYRRVAGEAPDAGTAEARHRFVALATLLLAALGAGAVATDVVGIALVGGCR